VFSNDFTFESFNPRAPSMSSGEPMDHVELERKNLLHFEFIRIIRSGADVLPDLMDDHLWEILVLPACTPVNIMPMRAPPTTFSYCLECLCALCLALAILNSLVCVVEECAHEEIEYLAPPTNWWT